MSDSNATKVIAGQPSFLLESDRVEAAITRRAGMLAPVTFCRDTDRPVQPYAIAPWAEEAPDPTLPGLLVCLRGDFLCSTFGGNDEPFAGRALPPHGETANNDWTLEGTRQTSAGQALWLTMDLTERGGKCASRFAVLQGQDMVYHRADFTGVDGPLNPGHHATLQMPDRPGAGRLSFSRFLHAHTFVAPAEDPAAGGYSALKPDAEIADPASAPCANGETTDLFSYPARRGFEDIAILCADPTLDVAWSAVTFPDEGYVWFALRDPKTLPSTTLWFSNGGRHYAPWSGRHVNVLGVEDMTGFFHVGLAASARENSLSRRGIVTCHHLTPADRLTVNYIQGVAQIPEGFDRLAAVERATDDTVRLVADSGVAVTAPCRMDFVRTGELEGLIEG